MRGPDGDILDIALAAVRTDSLPSVWYAINPTLRHWLGRLEPIDERRWRLRMEPFHVAYLEELRAAGSLAGCQK